MDNGFPGAYAGFALLEGCTGNQLMRNVASSNGADGFVLDGSNGNTVRENAGYTNGSIGFWARNGASHNVFERNAGRGNGYFDAVDDQSGEANLWVHNKFGTTAGI